MNKASDSEIALIISSRGVKGFCLIGKTPKEKEEALKFYALLESDLRRLRKLLNARINKVLLNQSN